MWSRPICSIAPPTVHTGTPAESDGAADYVATQHALVAAVCAALAPLLADVQEGVRAVLGGDGPEQERCDVVDFHIEGVWVVLADPITL